MSSTAPDYIPDDTSPDYIPDDTPEYIAGDDQSEEQKKRFDRLNALGKPLPGLELTPFEKMAQFVAPRLQQEDVRAARQIGTEFAGGVADAATTAARFLEMGTHPGDFAAAVGEHAAGVPENQITSATPVTDRLAALAQRGLAGVGLDTPMPGPGLGQIIQDPARLLRNPVEIPEAVAKFAAGSAPYMLMPALGGETAAARLAKTLAVFSPMAAGEPLSRGDIAGAATSTAQNALGLLALHGVTSGANAVGRALGPPSFDFTPADRSGEAAPEKLPPETPVVPSEPGPNLQLDLEKPTLGPVAQTALNVADRAAKLKVAEAQGLTPDQQIAFATGARGAESPLPPAEPLPAAQPLPAADALPESTQVPGVVGKLDRPVNNLAMAVKAVRLSETPEDLAWAQAQFDALKPGQIKGNPDVFEQELASKRAELEKNPQPATAPVPLERLPEVPAEAPGVPQDRSVAKPVPPVPQTPEQADGQAYALARTLHESLPQTGAKYAGLPDGSVSVSLPSGRAFVLTLKDSLPPTQAAIDAHLKLHPEQTGMNFEGEGMSHVVNGDVVMSLSRAIATGKTMPHEGNHVIDMLGLRTPEEHAALARELAPGETDPRVIDERISEAVENAPTPGVKAQIVNTLNRFGGWLKSKGYQVGFVSDKPLPNVRLLIEDARTGRAMARKTAPGDVAPEGAAFKLRAQTPDDLIIQRDLVDRYGTTDDNTARGWILPDGRLVPIRGRMTHEETRWNDNLPHRVGESTIPALTSSGIIRVDPRHGGYEIGSEPTPEQISRLHSMMKANPAGANWFDLHEGRGTPSPRYAGLEGDRQRPESNFGQIARFYRGEELQQRMFKVRPVAKEDASPDDFLSHAELSKGEHGPLAYRKYAVVAADTDVGDTPGNVAGRAALLKELRAAGYKPIESAGVWEDPTTHVRGAEPSLLVPGMDRETALALGKKYHQTAVVHIDPSDAGGSGVLFTGGEFAGKMKRWTGRVIPGADPSGHTEVTTDKGPFAFTLPTSNTVVDQPNTGTVGLVHLSSAPADKIVREGLKKRFAGTGAQGTERRSGEPTVWGYEPGTKPEEQVARQAQSVVRMNVPGKVLRVGSPEYNAIADDAHRSAAANDYQTPAESAMRTAAKGAGYVGFAQGGKVKLFDDVKPSDIEGAQALTPELRDQLNSHGMFKLKPKDEPTPLWYSKLERAIEEKMPRVAPADQVRGIVKSAGVKPEEAEWSDLEGYLQAHPKADKAELLQHLKDNQVQVQEVWKGLPPATISAAERQELFNLHTREREAQGQLSADEWDRIGELESRAYAASGLPEGWKVQPFTPEFGDNKFEVLDTQGNQRGSGPTEDDAIKAARINAPEDTKALTKFASYQLPGGENYRELLLTSPSRARSVQEIDDEMDSLKMDDPAYGEQYATLMRERNQAKGYASGGADYRSPHWDEPNVLAHVRMNDRVGPNGEKILHLEEIQSDWHQKGREGGYRGESLPEAGLRRVRVLEDRNAESPEAITAAERAELVQLRFRSRSAAEGVPDAPFKKTWHELALKRMMRYAAENGYDKLSWTTGEQQAERYDLSKQVDGIDYARKDDGNYTIGFRKNGAEVHAANDVAPEKIADYIGKDAAQKVLDNVGRDPGGPKDSGYLTGVDLKVGGEGMKGFYDKILPEAANKIAKRWGARVGEMNLDIAPRGGEGGRGWRVWDGDRLVANQSTEEGARNYLKPGYRLEAPDVGTVHSLDITPSMRESLGTEPQPLFKIVPKVEDTSLIDSPERRAARAKWTEELDANRGFANAEDASHKVRPQQRATIVLGGGDAVRLAHREGAVIVDPTEAANLIPERARFGDLVNNEAQNIANEIATRAISKGQNIVVNQRMTPEEADAYQTALEANGYKVTRVGVPEGTGSRVQQEEGPGARPDGGQGTTAEGRVRPAPEADRGARVATEAAPGEGRVEPRPPSELAKGKGPGTPRGGQMETSVGRLIDQVKKVNEGSNEAPEPDKMTVPDRLKEAPSTVGTKAEKGPGRAWTPVDTTIGKYDAKIQYTERRAAELAESINREIPNKNVQRSIERWIEADGDEAKLTAWRDSGARLTNPDLRDVYDRALNLSPAHEELAKEVSYYFRGEYQRLKDAGLLKEAYNDFVHHVWSKVKGPGEANSDTVGGGPDTTKQRIFPAFADGEDRGFTEKGALADTLQHYARTVGSKVSIAELKKEILGDHPITNKGQTAPKATDGRPMALVGDHPHDYKMAESSSMHLGQHIIWLHPEIANRLNKPMRPSMVKEFALGRYVTGHADEWHVGKGALDGQRAVKDTMVAFSKFHGAQLRAHAAFHWTNPFNPPEIDLDGDPRQMKLMRHGYTVGGSGTSEGLGGIGLLKYLGPKIANWAESSKVKTFGVEGIQPRIKMATALNILERNFNRYKGNLNEDQIYQKTAVQANAAFGGQNARFFGRSKSAQDVASILAFAPDFLESRVKSVAQAFGPHGKEQVVGLSTAAIGMWTIARVLNMAANNGDPKITKDDGSLDTDNMFAVQIGQRSIGFRSEVGDIQHLLQDPRGFFYNRLGPVYLRPTIELLEGRNQWGQKVNPLQTIGSSVAGATPILVQNGVRKAASALLGKEDEGDHLSTSEILLSAILSNFAFQYRIVKKKKDE